MKSIFGLLALAGGLWAQTFTTTPASIKALNAVTPAADKFPYWTSGTTAANADLTAAARTLLDNTATTGDILYASATNTWSNLAGNTTTTKKFLTQTGDGVNSAAPGWNTIVTGDINSLTNTWANVQTFTAQPIMSSLTASLPVFTDGSKGLVSNAMTGTGNVVMSASPTLTGTITAAAANFSATVKGTASSGGSTAAFLSSSGTPAYAWQETDAATDAKLWDIYAGAGVWNFRAVNDANSAARDIFVITRDAGGVTPYKITDIAIANTSDNPTIRLLGTGAVSVGGALSVTGHTTFEGVTSTGATGTGNIMYSASPTTTGTLTGAIANWSGLGTFNGGITLGTAQVFKGGATGGPHAIGSTNGSVFFYANPTSFSPGGQGAVMAVGGTINAVAGSGAYGLWVLPTIVEAASGNHGVLASAAFSAPTITSGVATVSVASTIYVFGAPTATASTGNFALYVLGGTSYFGGQIDVGINQNAMPSQNAAAIFGTTTSGAAYPFLTAGNLVLASRSTGANRDVVFVTGATPTVRGRVLGTGSLDWGYDLIVYSDNTFATAKFTVTAASGNTDVQGTLGVTGTLTGGVANWSGLGTFNGGITLGTAQVFQGGATAAGHAFGATSSTAWFLIAPTAYTSGASASSIMRIGGTINAGVGLDAYGLRVAPTIVEAVSGNHPLLAGTLFSIPTVTGDAATATNTANVFIAGAMTATVSGANYALWVDAGKTKLDGDVDLAIDAGTVGIRTAATASNALTVTASGLGNIPGIYSSGGGSSGSLTGPAFYGFNSTTNRSTRGFELSNSNLSYVTISEVEFAYSMSVAGFTGQFKMAHTDNGNTASHIQHLIQAGGTGGGDPFSTWSVPSGGSASLGIDNSIASDPLVAYKGTSLSTGANLLFSLLATAHTYGNATDNPTYTWAGTGAGSFGGALTVTGITTLKSSILSHSDARSSTGAGGTGGAPTAVSVTGKTRVVLAPTGAGQVYELTNPTDGQVIYIINNSSNLLYISNGAGGHLFTVPPDGTNVDGDNMQGGAIVIYDSTIGTWRKVASTDDPA